MYFSCVQIGFFFEENLIKGYEIKELKLQKLLHEHLF